MTRFLELEHSCDSFKNHTRPKELVKGSSEYHNFHHTLEVSYLSLQMLPREFRNYRFNSTDYELLLIAGLLHDYDPDQLESDRNPGA